MYNEKVDYSRFMNTTARIALKLIPDSLQTQPEFHSKDHAIILCDSWYDKDFKTVDLSPSLSSIKL